MNNSTQKMPVQKKYSKSIKGGRTFAICIDGSDHAEGAFNIVRYNFLTKPDFLLCVYIFNSKKDNDFNYKNKKETIINNYQDKLSLIDSKKWQFKFEDRYSAIHPLEQVNKIAYEHKADYLFCGFFGLKGPKGDNNELSKGIDYMLKSASEPFVIIKDITQRENKQNSQFNWLFVMDGSYLKIDLILDKFLPLIDIENDNVHGLGLNPTWNPNDELQNIFDKKINEHEIQKHSFETISYDKSSAKIVNRIVNFGEVNYDFVVLFNSRDKYSVEQNSSDNAQILLAAKANICVYNQ